MTAVDALERAIGTFESEQNVSAKREWRVFFSFILVKASGIDAEGEVMYMPAVAATGHLTAPELRPAPVGLTFAESHLYYSERRVGAAGQRFDSAQADPVSVNLTLVGYPHPPRPALDGQVHLSLVVAGANYDMHTDRLDPSGAFVFDLSHFTGTYEYTNLLLVGRTYLWVPV